MQGTPFLNSKQTFFFGVTPEFNPGVTLQRNGEYLLLGLPEGTFLMLVMLAMSFGQTYCSVVLS